MIETIAGMETARVNEITRRGRAAARSLATLTHQQRCDALLGAARALEERAGEILAANHLDTAAAHVEVESGKMSQALLQRLKTSERGIADMAERVREVARLPDPLGRSLGKTELDDGLVLHRVSCPLGLIGIIFESRPDVIPQIASLALKSGNAVIFKGGSEARNSNEVLTKIWLESLSQFPEIPRDTINLLHTREDVAQLLKLSDDIDLIIPRGSKQFVNYIAETSRIPVLGHGEGVCHVFVDRAANLEKATAIAFDSKVQYPAACNAMETLLVHQEIASAFLPEMIRNYKSAGVEVRGCARTIALNGDDVVPAEDSDWATEYSDLVVSIKIVESAEDAIKHIQQYGSSHTESIVTEDKELAARFLEVIDAAGVYHNVSTRFADGFRYGLGAELGISTSKLHARGPVGLDGITTYKYKLMGDGHTVAMYNRGERVFKHRRIE